MADRACEHGYVACSICYNLRRFPYENVPPDVERPASAAPVPSPEREAPPTPNVECSGTSSVVPDETLSEEELSHVALWVSHNPGTAKASGLDRVLAALRASRERLADFERRELRLSEDGHGIFEACVQCPHGAARASRCLDCTNRALHHALLDADHAAREAASLRAELSALREQAATLLKFAERSYVLLDNVTDDDECERDHHGNCQTRHLERNCSVAAARQLLDEYSDKLDEAAASLSSSSPETADRPEIICLCGSSRFIDHFAVFAWELEKGGKIVLSLHLLPADYAKGIADHIAEAEGVAAQMDELHLRKIDLADRVIVMNVGGYYGDSTKREIAYARAHGKPVSFLEPEHEHAAA